MLFTCCTHDDNPVSPQVCSFGTRSTVLGSLVFNRRLDSLRSGLANLAGRAKDYTATTLHRYICLYVLMYIICRLYVCKP